MKEEESLGATPHNFSVDGMLFYVDPHNEIALSPQCTAMTVRTGMPLCRRPVGACGGGDDEIAAPARPSVPIFGVLEVGLGGTVRPGVRVLKFILRSLFFFQI